MVFSSLCEVIRIYLHKGAQFQKLFKNKQNWLTDNKKYGWGNYKGNSHGKS